VGVDSGELLISKRSKGGLVWWDRAIASLNDRRCQRFNRREYACGLADRVSLGGEQISVGRENAHRFYTGSRSSSISFSFLNVNIKNALENWPLDISGSNIKNAKLELYGRDSHAKPLKQELLAREGSGALLAFDW
jgi:hypothetical protein